MRVLVPCCLLGVAFASLPARAQSPASANVTAPESLQIPKRWVGSYEGVTVNKACPPWGCTVGGGFSPVSPPDVLAARRQLAASLKYLERDKVINAPRFADTFRVGLGRGTNSPAAR